MPGDFSRTSFSRAKQYTAVWAQQGRVQLDSDLNERTAILLDYLRTLAVDFIGPFGGHSSTAGFEVSLSVTREAVDIVLSPGHYYVYGLRCQVAAVDGADEPCTVSFRGRVGSKDAPPLPDPPFVVALLVWEQTISRLQDPDLSEPALGATQPDTSVRTQVRWDLGIAVKVPDQDVAPSREDVHGLVDAYIAHNALGRPAPLLRARAVAPPSSSMGHAAQGIENQLYRVEVHTGGSVSDATFKWSRDNASVGLPVDSLSPSETDGVLVAILAQPVGGGADLTPGDWVELVDDDWAPTGRPAPLLVVRHIAEDGRQVTLGGGDIGACELGAHAFLRRWDQAPDALAADNSILITEDPWIDLEDGVQIQFVANAAEYQRGDYWLIPARAATAGVLWPTTNGSSDVSPPHGPARYWAPLALIDELSADGVIDLRSLFTHMADQQLEVAEVLPPQAVVPQPVIEQPVIPDPVPSVVAEPAPEVHTGSPAPRVRLIVQSGLEDGTAFDLPIGEWAVGRLPGSTIYLEDDSVSRRHALLTVDATGLTVTDDRSTNGTSVNGGLITRPTRIEPGDTVTFGAVEMLVARISSPPADEDPESPHHHHWPFHHDDATDLASP